MHVTADVGLSTLFLGRLTSDKCGDDKPANAIAGCFEARLGGGGLCGVID